MHHRESLELWLLDLASISAFFSDFIIHVYLMYSVCVRVISLFGHMVNCDQCCSQDMKGFRAVKGHLGVLWPHQVRLFAIFYFGYNFNIDKCYSDFFILTPKVKDGCCYLFLLLAV